MRRRICGEHAHKLKGRLKRAQLDESSCAFCKREAKPITLQDFARELESIAVNLRIAAADEWYDPHGITFLGPLEKVLNRFLKSITPAYRDALLNAIQKGLK